jgi:hypothetical protein
VGKSAIERDRSERLQFFLSADELAAVDDFWFQSRMPSRAAARSRAAKAGTDVPRWNASPSQELLIIRRNHKTGLCHDCPGRPRSGAD